jgi:hypothetical protein
MKKYACLLAYLGASMLSVFIATGSAAAQESPLSPASSQARGSQRPARGDGIKVHGHWAIDVRNSDGSLSSHNEFENACLECGKVIAAVLGRQQASWLWLVNLQPSNATGGVCKNASDSPSICQLLEVGQPDNGVPATYFPTLTVIPDLLVGTLELNGHITASFAGDIFEVSAAVNTPNAFFWVFSFRELASAIQIAAGQQVYVKVTFSFS